MRLETIIEEWTKDSRIDDTEIFEEQISVARLHQKYLNYLMFYKAQAAGLGREVARMKRDRLEYYRGRASGENGRAFAYKIPTQDVSIYLEADDAFQALQEKLETAQFGQFYVEKIVKMVEGRSWDIRSAADILKRMTGG